MKNAKWYNWNNCSGPLKSGAGGSLLPDFQLDFEHNENLQLSVQKHLHTSFYEELHSCKACKLSICCIWIYLDSKSIIEKIRAAWSTWTTPKFSMSSGCPKRVVQADLHHHPRSDASTVLVQAEKHILNIFSSSTFVKILWGVSMLTRILLVKNPARESIGWRWSQFCGWFPWKRLMKNHEKSCCKALIGFKQASSVGKNCTVPSGRSVGRSHVVSWQWTTSRPPATSHILLHRSTHRYGPCLNFTPGRRRSGRTRRKYGLHSFSNEKRGKFGPSQQEATECGPIRVRSLEVSVSLFSMFSFLLLASSKWPVVSSHQVPVLRLHAPPRHIPPIPVASHQPEHFQNEWKSSILVSFVCFVCFVESKV